MRIRNKLLSVQLIMALTLFLSILIFAQYINTNISIENAQIKLGQYDSEISRYDLFINAAVNKRLTAIVILYELEKKIEPQKTYIDYINSSSFFSNSKLKEKTKDLIKYYNFMTTRSLRYFTSNLENTTGGHINIMISEYGISEALKTLRMNPEYKKIPKEYLLEVTNDLNTLYISHKDLSKEYNDYFKFWNDTKIDYFKQLEAIKANSGLKTLILLILVIAFAFFFGYTVTNKITVSLNQVNSSLVKMTSGDFSSNLDIVAGDEFGDLSRRFNRFIDKLWKKLDSMNIIMNDIGHAMNEDLNLAKIQTNILNNVSSHILCDASAILLFDEGKLKMSTSKGHFPPFYPIEEDLSDDRPMASRYLYEHDIPLHIDIIEKCLESKKPMIVKQCNNDIYFPHCRNKESATYINSFMMVPLINAGTVIGLFVLIRVTTSKLFSDLDFSNFTSFGDYAALTIDTLRKYNELLEKFEMQKEIGVAADIQQSLIPGKMPTVKGITSSAFTLAAKGVSGDYYDFFRMNKYTIGATVCDVAGKGVPASLVMVMIRTILRLVSSPHRGAAETLTMLNKSISGKIDVDRYATMAFFKIDLEHMKLNYSNAAHHPIQIFRQKNQKFYAIDSPGLPIGIDRDAKFTEKRVSLLPGDIIFMYTDGFPEARNSDGDEYSTNRMLREIRLHCNSNAEQILNSIVDDMHKFTARANQHDDQTILIIKIDEEK